jgi:hypothetical protein
MSNKQNIITVPVGNTRIIETWELHSTFRTLEQFQIVQAIVQSPEFDFSCNSQTFKPDGTCDSYQGRFTFLWFAKDGSLRATSISSKGKRVFTVQAR